MNKEYLSNGQRGFLGLNPLLPHFEAVPIGKHTMYFDGDIIKKLIYFQPEENSYSEADTEIATENRQWILPTSQRGKKHPLNALKLSQTKHKGILASTDFKNFKIKLENRNNNQAIEIPLPESVSTLDTLQTFFPSLMKQAPDDWSTMVQEIKDKPKKTVRYKNGDIFRVALDWKKFAYGLIIGRFQDYRKWEMIPKYHPFSHIMTVPVVVRLFDLLTDDPNTSMETLEQAGLQSPIIVMDDTILRGTHPVVMHKDLQEEDILFPMHQTILYRSNDPDSGAIGYVVEDNQHLNHLISLGYRPQLTLAWGFGMLTKGTEELKNNPPPVDDFQRTANVGIGMLYLRDVNGKPHVAYPDFARHPGREKVFTYFGVDPNISFDEFNIKYGGMTRRQYLDLLKEKKAY